MDEIASAFSSAALPAGFHQAAAEVFSRLRLEEAEASLATLDTVIAALTKKLAI
jgi:hypothetical protein